jgi:hypothetical protein
MRYYYIESLFGRGIYCELGGWSLSDLLLECRRGEGATEIWLFGGRLYLCVDSKLTAPVAVR